MTWRQQRKNLKKMRLKDLRQPDSSEGIPTREVFLMLKDAKEACALVLDLDEEPPDHARDYPNWKDEDFSQVLNALGEAVPS